MFSFGHCPNEGGGEGLARIKKYTLYIPFWRPKNVHKLPERGGGEVIRAIPERRHSFFRRCSLTYHEIWTKTIHVFLLFTFPQFCPEKKNWKSGGCLHEYERSITCQKEMLSNYDQYTFPFENMINLFSLLKILSLHFLFHALDIKSSLNKSYDRQNNLLERAQNKLNLIGIWSPLYEAKLCSAGIRIWSWLSLKEPPATKRAFSFLLCAGKTKKCLDLSFVKNQAKNIGDYNRS